MTTPRKIKYKCDIQELKGFKLGHFKKDDGAYKAVFWSEELLYIYPFNIDEDKDSSDKSLKNNRAKAQIKNVEVLRILDFGITEMIDDYSAASVEALIVED